MEKVKFYISNGFYGKQEEVFKYPDDITNEQINDDYDAWCEIYLDTG